jgi:hypothetical protein
MKELIRLRVFAASYCWIQWLKILIGTVNMLFDLTLNQCNNDLFSVGIECGISTACFSWLQISSQYFLSFVSITIESFCYWFGRMLISYRDKAKSTTQYIWYNQIYKIRKALSLYRFLREHSFKQYWFRSDKRVSARIARSDSLNDLLPQTFPAPVVSFTKIQSLPISLL